MKMTARVTILALLVAGLSMSGATYAQRPGPVVQVYKAVTCGCCANWVQHLQAHGFTTEVTDVEDIAAVKVTHNVPVAAQSCHTAVVDGYVVEGHVPAADVQRLLRERPAVAGIAVPGMPIGSPGMEVPGVAPQRYNVFSFDRGGQLQIYASH
jgi:hypothetical protein